MSLLTVFTSCEKEKEPEYLFRIGHVANEDHTWHRAFLYFKEIVEKRSNGRIRVEVYPSEQLGNEVDIIRGIRAGIVEMTATAAILQKWTDMAALSEMPFMIRDSTHLRKLANGPIGKQIEASILKETGLRILTYFPRGPRHLTSNRPIRHPDDLKGIIIRVPNVPSYVTTWSALGAKPTPMAFSEVFTSLQQGTIEAQENPLAMIRSANFQEVQKYVNLTGHVISWAYIVVGDKQFQRMPPDLQQLFLDCGKEMQSYERKLFLENESLLRAELEQKGMVFIDVDKQAFRDKSADAIRNSLTPEIRELHQQIIDMPE